MAVVHKDPTEKSSGLATLTGTPKQVGEAVWNPLVDHVGVHGTQLLPDLALDISAKPPLWRLLELFGLRHGLIRRLPCPLFHNFALSRAGRPLAAGCRKSISQKSMSWFHGQELSFR